MRIILFFEKLSIKRGLAAKLGLGVIGDYLLLSVQRRDGNPVFWETSACPVMKGERPSLKTGERRWWSDSGLAVPAGR